MGCGQIPLQPQQRRICRSQIGCQRNVVYVAQPQQGRDIRLVRLGRERIAQENHGQNPFLGNPRTDLLVTSQRPAEHALNVQPGVLGQDVSGGSSGDQVELRQNLLMPLHKGQQIVFLTVVGNQGDLGWPVGLSTHGSILNWPGRALQRDECFITGTDVSDQREIREMGQKAALPLGGVLLRGMAMGAADVVPGVSGGTIAFIAGIYDRLVGAISAVPEALVELGRGGLAAAWRRLDGTFLLTLAAGILISIFSLAQVITYLMHWHPVPLWSFFFGLIVASTVYVGREVKRWDAGAVLGLIAGTALVFWLSVQPPFSPQASLPFLFFAGALASCAMILPGISGSFILLLIGAYAPVLAAVSGRDLLTVAVVGTGAVLGLVLFSRLLHYLLERHRNPLMGVLTGFLVGSLWKIWPWKADPVVYHKELGPQPLAELTGGAYGSLAPYLQSLNPEQAEALKAYLQTNVMPATYERLNQATSGDVMQAVLAALLGFGLIFGIEAISARLAARSMSLPPQG